MATKTIYLEGTIKYARVFENNRDMGSNLPEGSDYRNKLEETQGQYNIDLYVTPEEKQKAIKDGIPNKGMIGQRWKEDSEGNPYYKASRKHFNPKLKDKDTGEFGVVQGPPKVLKVVDGKNVAWDQAEDGYIGDGSKGVIKVTVWDGKIVDLQAVKVTEIVEYIPEEEAEGEYF